MPLPSSTLGDKIQRAKQTLNARLQGADAGIKRTVENAVAFMQAAMSHGIQGHAQWLENQAPPGPDSDIKTLETNLSIFGIPRKQPAKATGTLRIFGDVGTLVETTDLFQLADGTQFALDSNATIQEQGTPDYVDVAITAVVAGASGNAAIGTTLRLVNPVSGVDSEATVQDDGSGEGLTGGTDLEEADDMWTRLQQRLSNPPGPGTEGDFERWALEVAGVTRAWADGDQPLGAGTVRVYFVRDNDTTIFPSAGEVTTVQTYIDGKRPPTMITTVAAPTEAQVAMAIQVEVDPDSGLTASQVYSNITAALTDLFLRDAHPNGYTVRRSRISEAISSAFGEKAHNLVTPAADIVHTTGQLATVGLIGYSPL